MRDVHWSVTVDYQHIENGNIANQIHGITIDYGKFILITFSTEQDNEKNGLAPKQFTDIYTPLFTLRSLRGTKESGGHVRNWKMSLFLTPLISIRVCMSLTPPA